MNFTFDDDVIYGSHYVAHPEFQNFSRTSGYFSRLFL